MINKNKTFEELYGVKRAKEIKEKKNITLTESLKNPEEK